MTQDLLWGGFASLLGFDTEQLHGTSIFLPLVLMAIHTHMLSLCVINIKNDPYPPFSYRPYFHCGYAFCRLPLSQHYTVSISLFRHLCCSLAVFLLQPQPSNSALSLCWLWYDFFVIYFFIHTFETAFKEYYFKIKLIALKGVVSCYTPTYSIRGTVQYLYRLANWWKGCSKPAHECAKLMWHKR